MEQTITPKQITIIQTIISANKLAAYKDAIIASASNNRTTSTKELTKAEAAMIIKSLQEKYPYQPPPDPLHKMRGRILSICHTLGWYKEGRKLDYDRINQFCEKCLKKRLDKLDKAELQKMIYIFEKVEKDTLANR